MHNLSNAPLFSTVLFGMFVMATRGTSSAAEFFTGYVIEQSLSIDNLFVFIMLFDYFKIPLKLQSRVLTWGVGGAILLRATMISVGTRILERFKPIVLVFAGILLMSSFKLLTETTNESDDVSDNFGIRLATKLLPTTTSDFHGEKFFVRESGKRMATPLFLCLLCVELSDLVFAMDSLPAVLGVSKDPLIVLASNIAAMLGLRSIYTLVAKAVKELRYLQPAVAAVLGFVGVKMVAEYFHVAIGTGASLGVVCSLLGTGIVASIVDNNRTRIQLPSISLSPWTSIAMNTKRKTNLLYNSFNESY